jgi:FkbM family methyltransferase
VFIRRLAIPGPLLGLFRVARSRWQRARYSENIVNHTYASFPLSLYIADSMAAKWYDRDWPMPKELAVLSERKLKPGAFVLDAGAHQGLIAMLLARTVGIKGKVIAVEASPKNVEIARKNCVLNGISNIEVLHAAVGDKSGTLRFTPAINGQVAGNKEWASVEVPAVTVDALAERYGIPDVLFVDVEGYESHVLKGSRRSLEAGPDCFVEVHVGCGLERFGGTVERLMSCFPKGYEFLFLDPDTGAPTADLYRRFFLIASRH